MMRFLITAQRNSFDIFFIMYFSLITCSYKVSCRSDYERNLLITKSRYLLVSCICMENISCTVETIKLSNITLPRLSAIRNHTNLFITPGEF